MSERLQLVEWHQRFENLTYLDRIKLIFDEFDSSDILVTTSIGTTSVVLLHMIQKVQPNHPIYWIDTGFLFEETDAYREALVHQFGLNVVPVVPNSRSHDYTQKHEVWKKDPDFCCFVNKVEPLRLLKESHQIWISGLLRYQNENRAGKPFLEAVDGLIKGYPILDMSREDLNLYRSIYELPAHPLSFRGYGSVGCKPCTAVGSGRAGRWEGRNKTECGLHN